MAFDPVNSSYPGTPIVLAFLSFAISVGVRSALLRRRRAYATPGQPHRGAEALVAFTAMVFAAVVLWVGFAGR